MAKEAQLQPYDLDDLAKDAEEAEQTTPETYSMKQVIGRDAFFAALVSTARNVKDGKTLHETKALVLACGSGVGKTFGTQTARKGFQHQDKEKKYKPVVAYLGFNSVAEASNGERSFLSAGNPDADTCVRVLVYCRLFAWLNAYARLSGPEQLDVNDSDVQQQFILPTLTKTELQRVDMGALTQRLKEMLTDLGNKQRDLVLIAVIDEGQMLDAETPDVSGNVQGARLALRCLRELQRTMGTQVRVVPVCTGIDPVVSLSSETEGQNISLDKAQEALLSIAEFESLLQKIIRPGTAEDEDIRIFASFTWPRARGVMRMADKERFIFHSNATALEWTASMNVRQVLQAAADGEYLDQGTVPANMTRLVDSEGRSRPLLEFSVLWSVAKQLRCVYYYKIPESVSLHALSKQKWGVFESNAFHTLVLFLCFFYHMRESNNFLPTKASTLTLRTWIPLSVKRVVCTKSLDNEQGRLHPFTRDKSRDKLSEEFSTVLSGLKNTGDTILMQCGGSAPLDFILVTLEEKNAKKTLQIRYADAKFTKRPTMKNMNELDEMTKKAQQLHTALQKIFSKRQEYTVPEWNDTNFLLITNSTLEGERVMSPGTTNWEPMTTLLYRSVKAEPTGAVLASRPVWPATLSRVPHVPCHTWITPLPPTRTRTTRWVPCLRRICKHI